MRTLVIATLLGLAAPLCQAQNPSAALPSIQLEAAAPVDLGSVPTRIPAKPVAFDVNAIDKSANPCQDFFQYACGSWNKNNPIPADRAAWGRFAELNEYNNYLLYKDLIAAAQAVEHYEMTRYGTLIAWAKQLGRPDCASVLAQNLEEEKAADSKLTAIAERNVNAKAA